MTESTYKAVSSPDEHEDHPGQTLVTRDHDTIRAWAQARGATPMASGSGSGRLPDAIELRLPDAEKEHADVSWDRWFEAFDVYDMRFVYREHERDGSVSLFFALDTSSHEES